VAISRKRAVKRTRRVWQKLFIIWGIRPGSATADPHGLPRRGPEVEPVTESADAAGW
jgi:hypothetical protein